MRFWPVGPAKRSSHQILVLVLALISLFAGGCVSVKTTKNTATLLKAYDHLTADKLIAKVNDFQKLQSLRASASIRLTDLKLSEQGKIEPYRPADGLLVLQRPESIRLLIRVPILKQNIADMTSDGEHFRIAVYLPEEYRRFLMGTNKRNYDDDLGKLNSSTAMGNSEKRQISSIARIRPQHITEALLLNPINLSDKVKYFIADQTREEPDTRPGQSSKLVVRSYQVLRILEEVENGELRLLREFWFDRTQPAVPLVRMEIYDQGGVVTSDVNYKNYQTMGALSLPGQVDIVRAGDKYALSLTLSSLEENGEIGKQAFILENSDNLPEKDLDAPLQPPRASPEHQ